MQIKYTIGLNMQCARVVVAVRLIKALATPTDTGFDCVVVSDGVKVYDKLANLFDTFEQAEAAL